MLNIAIYSQKNGDEIQAYLHQFILELEKRENVQIFLYEKLLEKNDSLGKYQIFSDKNSLEKCEIDYFFSLLKGSNVGLVLDTGHFMNTNPDLETEADGAEYICAMAEKLGSMKKLFRGMHLSCSLSGKYQKSCTAVPPENMDGETVMMHITSIDQHRPFTTEAARKIVECIEPAYLTHELFGDYGEISKEKLKIQMAAIGADGKGGKPISLCG